MYQIILIFLMAFNIYAADITDISNCKACHDIEDFDEKNHDFTCVACHVLPEQRANFEHKDIITHPDAPQNIDSFCVSCHQKDSHRLSQSLHTTLKGEILLTQELWGKHPPFDSLQTIQANDQDIHEPKDLVDDFLSRKCLKCHLGNQSSGEKGMNRGVNCMACHIEYNPNGTYMGSDSTMKGKKPYANRHQLASKPPMSTCLSCHNKTFIGTDYLGFFPKDHDKSYRAPLTSQGLYPTRTYGSDYHSLSEDVHLKLGFTCVDCHKKDEVMGNGVVYEKQADSPGARCAQCHQSISTNEAHQNYHDNLSCTSCHASWQMSHYELSVFRDDTTSYEQWKDLTRQEDNYLADFLQNALKAKVKPEPVMPNWVQGEMKEGLWYSGWRLRRWENILLGNDANGIIKPLRPLFQYRISYRDKNGTMILNDISSIDGKKIEAFVPFVPHTIGRRARACEMCHENPLLIKEHKTTNTVIDLFVGEIKQGSKLTTEQKEKLQSDKYRSIRAKMLFK